MCTFFELATFIMPAAIYINANLYFHCQRHWFKSGDVEELYYMTKPNTVDTNALVDEWKEHDPDCNDLPGMRKFIESRTMNQQIPVE